MQLFLLDLLHENLLLSSRVTRKLVEELPDVQSADNYRIIEAAATHSIRVQIFEELNLVAEDMLTQYTCISRKACSDRNVIVAESSQPKRRSLSEKLDDLHLELEEHKASTQRLLDLACKKYALSKDLRDVNQAFRSYWLTALAAIFLPMSLACSLLSMQVRVSQLHDLLCDFWSCFDHGVRSRGGRACHTFLYEFQVMVGSVEYVVQNLDREKHSPSGACLLLSFLHTAAKDEEYG